MNLLIDGAPETVYIGSLKYKINSDFRTCLLFEELIKNDNLSKEDKIYITIKLFFDNQYIDDFEKALDKIMWFYSCGRETKKVEDGGYKPIFSFEDDDIFVYAAFREVYNIDLTFEKLHWWKFKALFESIPDDVQLSKIMSYRAIKINKDMTESEKKFYRNMKKLYALPDNRTQEEKEADFIDALGL